MNQGPNRATRRQNKTDKTSVEVPAQTRPLEEIQKEYAQYCAQAGEVQYRIAVQEAQLRGLNQAIQKLNEEGDAAKRTENESK